MGSQNFPFKSFQEDGRRIIDTQNKKKRLQIEGMLNEERDVALRQRREDITLIEGRGETKRTVQKNTSTKMKTNFRSETSKRHVCEHCSKSFATRQTMLHHVKYNKKCIAS